MRQHRIDVGQEKGATTEQGALIRKPRRKNVELEQTIAILKAARLSSHVVAPANL